jgi:Pyridine nucleotide-disulphide oxidoreductase
MLNTVVVGAGPYGLSIAAHLRHYGIPFRIFGRPMDSWLAHMPKGMMLKSDGFASNISDPAGKLTLEKFCAERGIEYGHTTIPVKLETFIAYGLEFKNRILPDLEDKPVVAIDRISQGYALRTDDGDVLKARNIVLAVGITHYEYVPESLTHLPADLLSHSARYNDVDRFKGLDVIVIGGGASALDWAGLLHEAGAKVTLVARQPALKFHGKPTGKQRSLWERVQHPQTGLGPGWRSSLYANAPQLFYLLPESLRLEIVARTLGPSGGWFIKDKVVGQLPTFLGQTIQGAEVVDGKAQLSLRGQDGDEQRLQADHIIAATGYKVDLNRLQFLNANIRSKLKTVNGTPILASDFESSSPGLYFVGISAANSFGPVMRFAYGADFAARTVARALSRSFLREPASEPISSYVTTAR